MLTDGYRADGSAAGGPAGYLPQVTHTYMYTHTHAHACTNTHTNTYAVLKTHSQAHALKGLTRHSHTSHTNTHIDIPIA